MCSARQGDRASRDQLLPLLYRELTDIARRALAAEPPGHTLQTGALVHGAYLRLIQANVAYQDRAHFLAIAARTMRQVLVNHARARPREKRGGGAIRVDMDDVVLPTPAVPFDVLALAEALDRLSAFDARKARSWSCISSAGSIRKKPRRCWASRSVRSHTNSASRRRCFAAI